MTIRLDDLHPKAILNALRLSSEYLEDGRYRVSGTDEPEYMVSLYRPDEPLCTCAYQSYTDKPCKHTVHALLLEGHVPLMRLACEELLNDTGRTR